MKRANAETMKTDDMRQFCSCELCPSYTECMRAGEEHIFCMKTKSRDCKFDAVQCICTTCEVWKRSGMTHAYYCIRGTETEQQ